jgi:hypothetical protein
MTGSTKFGRPQLETLAQAEAENLRRIAALVDRSPDIAAALEACDRKARCGCVVCAMCSRAWRFRLIRKLLAIAKLIPGQHKIVTIFLEAVRPGKLATVKIKRAHDRLRKQLARSGFSGSHLVGGTEVEWNSATQTWILHVHLLAIGVPPAAWKRLRRALRGVGPKYPVKVQRLRNPERQISYSIKFPTYFRPKAHNGAGRPPAVPLPLDRLAELAAWWSGHTFDDFIFLVGAKRQGDRIVLDAARPSSRKLILRVRRNGEGST